jgi:hypothetical protein
MSSDGVRRDPNNVLERVVEVSAPYRFPDGWPRFRGRQDCRQWQEDSADRLRNLCDERQLRCAGLLDDSGRLHPNLPAPGKPLLPIRRKEDGPVVEVVTAAGCLRRSRLPLLAFLEDWYLQKLLAPSGGRILLAADLEDAMLLRNLCMPAAPATGLESAGSAELAALKSTFSWELRRQRTDENPAGSERSGEGGAVRIRPSHLTLVGFSVWGFEASLPEALEPVVGFLTRVMETIAGLDLTGVSVLEPDQATLERLRDAIRLQGIQGGHRMLVELVESHSYSLPGYRRLRKTGRQTAPDYQAARTSLRRLPDATLAGSASADRWDRAWEGLAEAVDREVAAPLHQAAGQASDPAARARWLAAAELARTEA